MARALRRLDDEEKSAVRTLSDDYRQDLDMLRALYPVIVSDVDIRQLNVLARKYDIATAVKRENYVDVLGALSAKIRAKLEELAIVHELESIREESIDRKPKKEIVTRQKMPDSIEDRQDRKARR
jgi:hypothetical protein